MKKLITILSVLVCLDVFADFKTLSTEQVQAKIKQGVAIIDVRRIDEYNKHGVIFGSHKLTFFDKNGRYDTQKWLAKLDQLLPSKDTPFILVCAHANRTKTIGHFLNKKTKYSRIFELQGGIVDGWIKKGLATTKFSTKPAKSGYKFW